MSEGDKESIFVVITIARQVQGEYVFVRGEGAFRQASKADELLKTLAKDFVTSDGKSKEVKLLSPNGDVVCRCEVGVVQLELI